MSDVTCICTPSRLRWARVRAGLSLVEAAAAILKALADRDIPLWRIGLLLHSVPVRTIKRWERGERRFDVSTGQAMASAYNIPLAIFYLPPPTLKDWVMAYVYRWFGWTLKKEKSDA